MHKLTIFLCMSIFLFAHCKSDDEMEIPVVTEQEPEEEEEEVEVTTSTGTEQYLIENSDYIFDQDQLHTFELNLPASALAKIDSDPAAEEYVEGSLTFAGETISPVGIRYKGSIGAYVGCLSGPDFSNPSGFKTCTKLSMKIKINWNGSDTKFYGLKKLQFHSMNNDPSQMRERLGYWLFRNMGVPAPRAVHARLLINGEYVGLFALVEQVDGRFTRHNYDDGKGNLYKEIWPLQSNGQAYPAQTYINHLKTNEDENPTAELIQNMAQEVANADPADLQNVVSKWMKIDEVIAYAVVDRMIRNDDGAFHWYCTGNACSPHNFYWYEEPTNETLHLIPWDLDHAFENIISNNNPVIPIADDWGEISANCQPFSYGAWGLRQRSAACDKLIGAWASYTDLYEQKKIEFIEGPFSAASVSTLLDQWKAQVETATLEANQQYGDAISMSEWNNALYKLRTRVDYAREN